MEMNKLRLAEIARWLEAGVPKRKGVAGFNMASWNETKSCGTTCCIGGAADAWWCGEGRDEDEVARSLGFADQQDPLYDELCYPTVSMNWRSITPAHAARCIRRLIATGKVDWKGTRRP